MAASLAKVFDTTTCLCVIVTATAFGLVSLSIFLSLYVPEMYNVYCNVSLSFPYIEGYM